MDYTRWDMQMHQNRKKLIGLLLRSATVTAGRPPVKFETGSRKGLVLCNCQKMYCGPSDTVPRTVRRTKVDWAPETHRFCVGIGNELRTVRGWMADRPPFNGLENNFLRCFWWFGCASGGPSAGFERTVRKNSETHRRGRRRQVRPRLWSGFVPKDL